MNLKPALLASTLACIAVHSAMASSSERFAMEGGSLRLLTSGLAGEDGLLRGALEIELRPGWKTYWRDPGSSGVPPQIDVSRSLNVSGAELHFPAPEWHEDTYGDWAGYGKPVVLPVTFTIAEPDRFSVVEASLFLGVCEAICVPVQANLTIEPGSQPGDEEDARIVEAAFASLPLPASDEFGVTGTQLSGDALTIHAAVPRDAGKAELFIAGSGGYLLGRPGLVTSGDGSATFTVPVFASENSGGNSGQAKLPYTLVAGDRAVAGELSLP